MSGLSWMVSWLNALPNWSIYPGLVGLACSFSILIRLNFDG